MLGNRMFGSIEADQLPDPVTPPESTPPSEEKFDLVFVVARGPQIVALAAKTRLPAMYATTELVRGGGLMGYGVNLPEMYRRGASFVDRILKGAKPADLPVEQPTVFELVINLRTAEALGLTIPPAVLARADEVIQ
jgi:putative ABC transport system substrate-binding protein